MCAVQDQFHGHFNETDYEMESFWDTMFPANLFGQNPAAVKERSSLELDSQNAVFRSLRAVASSAKQRLWPGPHILSAGLLFGRCRINVKCQGQMRRVGRW